MIKETKKKIENHKRKPRADFEENEKISGRIWTTTEENGES